MSAVNGSERRIRDLLLIEAMLATARVTDTNHFNKAKNMSVNATADMQAKMKAAREKLDAHVREIELLPEIGRAHV